PLLHPPSRRSSHSRPASRPASYRRSYRESLRRGPSRSAGVAARDHRSRPQPSEGSSRLPLMRFLHPDQDEQRELSLEDVFICPSYFDGKSRLEVDLRPDDFALGSHPLVSANMNAVTGKRMA